MIKFEKYLYSHGRLIDCYLSEESKNNKILYFSEEKILKKDHKGLPVNLFVSVKKASHWLRIKFQPNESPKFNESILCSMTIPYGKGTTKFDYTKFDFKGDCKELSRKNKKYLLVFGKINFEALLEFWNSNKPDGFKILLSKLRFEISKDEIKNELG